MDISISDYGLLISLGVAVASGLVYPSVLTQKIQATGFGLLMGLASFAVSSLTTQMGELQKNVRNLSAVYVPALNEDIEEAFRNIYLSYNNRIYNSEPIIQDWAGTIIKSLDRNLSNGVLPIPVIEVEDKAVDIYKNAEKSIFATSSRLTTRFLENKSYIEANKDAGRKHVPIIRFFIWDGSSNGGDSAIDELAASANIVHEKTQALFTAVVDGRKIEGGIRELLLVDNKYYVELNKDTVNKWQASASSEEEHMEEVRDYLRRLIDNAKTMGRYFYPSNDKVLHRYPTYQVPQAPIDKPYAVYLVDKLIEEL